MAAASGVVSLCADVAIVGGGGAAAGAVQLISSNSLKLDEKQLIDLGFAIVEQKYPSLAPLVKSLQTEIDVLLSPPAAS